MKMKYVIVEFDGFPMPFIFPDLPKHTDVAHILSSSFKGGEIRSAGFCWYDQDKQTWVCYGESTSLKMKSREDIDVRIFNQMFQVDR